MSGVKRGDVLLAIDGRPVERPADVLHVAAPRQTAGTRAQLHLLRLGSREVVALQLAPLPHGNNAALLRARRRRHLHAARRRRRAAAPPGRRGHAALLLAVPGVLRRVHVLVQRAARSARLGLLLGRRRLDPAAAAALPALHARVPRAAAQLGAHAAGHGRPAAAVPAGARCSDWPAWWRWRARRSTRGSSRRRSTLLDRLEPLYLSMCFAARSGGADARVRARALGHGAAPAAVDRLGHGARRGARSRWATRCRTRSASSRRCRWSCRRSR